MNREQLLELMAEAVRKHLAPADVMLVRSTALAHPERWHALLAAAAGQQFTEQAFAAFALQCAKRIAAGPPA